MIRQTNKHRKQARAQGPFTRSHSSQNGTSTQTSTCPQVCKATSVHHDGKNAQVGKSMGSAQRGRVGKSWQTNRSRRAGQGHSRRHMCEQVARRRAQTEDAGLAARASARAQPPVSRLGARVEIGQLKQCVSECGADRDCREQKGQTDSVAGVSKQARRIRQNQCWA